ncbi:uncharacterized protein LOC125484717 [Rhincodon typus]|uniref:uncharacterized protein LOC125484717 n=1 Tax=Rhincodon typus TaxID=259920 RepID=UPI002030ECA4|nr:uncharacterized protein LOC125484717 [Rhincodon typus]
MNWLVMLVTCIQFHNLPVVAYRQVITFSAIPCDAVGAVKAADLAVYFINNVRRKGFKYRLNRLKNAQEKQEQYEKSYYLEFEVFETRCPVRSSKPLKRCGIRPFRSMKSFGECKIIIRISKGLQNVKDFQCSEYSGNLPAIYMHLGFCTASFDSESPDDDAVDVNCDIYATKGVTVRGLSGQVEPHEDNYPDGEQIFKPKLKRSISKSKWQKMKRPGRKDSSSSESSEEQQMRRHHGPFRHPTIHYHIFPNLPPHPYTCPGQPRYVLRTQ